MSEPTITLEIDVTESELMCLIDCLETGPKNTAGHFVDRRNLILKINAALEGDADAPRPT